MTKPGEEMMDEYALLSEETTEAEDTETIIGQSSLEEEDDERDDRLRKRRKQQQKTGMEQLTYSRMTHLLAVYQNKVQENHRVIATLKRQKDSQLQAVISQLLLLEARLRREQKGIVGQLAQRDHVIAAQRQEIDRLRRDNRRLINRLKKVSEACEVECQPRLKISRVEAEESGGNLGHDHTASLTANPTSPTRKSSPGVIRVATSVSELINSSGGKEKNQKSPPSVCQLNGRNGQKPPPPVNPNVTLIRATTDRVFHKPPIAEKPRNITKQVRGQIPHRGHIVRNHNGKCTIVSTISRLLEEESDATTTGSSEPSSPEATLKPHTPRVIRLARRFEESNVPSQQSIPSGPSQSPDAKRRDDPTSKSYIMDEYEVTSGYNSDAVSDHEYENIQVVTCRETEAGKTQHSDVGKDEACKDKTEKEEEEEEDNYVILRAVTENSDSGRWVDVPDDQHIYSNVEFSSGLLIKEVEEEEEEEMEERMKDTQGSPTDGRSPHRSPHNLSTGGGVRGVLETNLDISPSSSPQGHYSQDVENVRAVRRVNVPRSRHNINLIIESDGDHMTENFEEFTLDSLELEEEREREEEGVERGRGKENQPVSELRRCGDGAETKEGRGKEDIQREAVESLGIASPGGLANGQYEKFLEATGLSQKSILTPTRMFSNHRSVLKPRDIKHRNKLRAAFTTLSTLEESPGSAGGSRYWTEPYL